MIAVLALAAVFAQAAPPNWTHVSSAGISFDVPPGATLRQVAPQTWELHNRDLTLGLAIGPQVADADDGEPHRCYSTALVSFDGTQQVLRTTRPKARADCPEGYASLYQPPARAGGPALFLWAWDESGGSAATVRAVIRSIRFDAAR